MSEVARPSSVSDTSVGNENGKLRRAAPARSSRRIAKQENEEDSVESAKPQKKEKKQEKKPTKAKLANDSELETVITESGLVLHPNGTFTCFLH
jgi:hypothetical protein